MMPEPGPEAASMDQAAGEAMRMAAELVAVGTMAVAQQTRRREHQAEAERQRILRETREVARRDRQAPREDQPEVGAEASEASTAAATEDLDRTQELPPLDVDPETTAPLPAVRAGATPDDDLEPASEVPVRAEFYRDQWNDAWAEDIEAAVNGKPPFDMPLVVAVEERARVAELASSPIAPPAEVARALVDVGAQPTSAENLGTAVAKAAAQPKPARSASLGRSPLPGHDLSR
jgi:hypothetical protein